MAEAIHCPSCSTRYRLRPERLKPIHRRAQCFTCGGIFPVGDVVSRLLGDSSQPEDATLRLETMLEDLGPTVEAPFEAPESMPSLTLGDLEGAEDEIMDKTLVEAPAALPERKEETLAPASRPDPITQEFPPEITETTLSGYTSARDAIDKLFGDAPTQPKGLTIQPTDENPMDLEATLSALESTLSGTEPAPLIPGHPSVEASPIASGPAAGGGTEEATTSTMRMTQAEILAAIQAAPDPGERKTVPMPAAMPTAAPAASPAFAPPAGNADAGAELLRLKIGEEIYGGLTMPQLIAWVEEGRILENHLVARQYSENWLEAHKVPGLRPVFERLRRERLGITSAPESGISDAPKKGLFGGLFGKG